MTADPSAEVDALLRTAAQLARDYGLRRSAIVEATEHAAHAWQRRGEDVAAIDPDTDGEFMGAVVEALQAEAQRRAH